MSRLTTVPTGSSAGSAAATPVRTCTPDAVVSPLQYAVAVKCSREPGCGEAAVSASIAKRASRTVASYTNTKPTTAPRVATAFRQNDRVRNMLELEIQRRSLRPPRNTRGGLGFASLAQCLSCPPPSYLPYLPLKCSKPSGSGSRCPLRTRTRDATSFVSLPIRCNAGCATRDVACRNRPLERRGTAISNS